jgi:magnesium-transporting ATPase (P-type)
MARIEESTTTPTDDEGGSTLWAWVAAFLIILVTFVGLVGAVHLTPGSPSSCNLPSRSGWFLCDWTREFVANVVIMTLVLVGTTVPLALVVGMTRALVRAARD